MKNNRTAAIIVGVLYIIGTVAGVASMALTSGLSGGLGSLGAVASSANQVLMAAVCVLIMGLALAMVPAVMFPILKKKNEALAIGYVVFRGALETFTYLAVALSWLLLVAVARQYAGAAATVASQASALRTLLTAAQAPMTAIQDIVFSLGALMFYCVLYQARLVPRWLSVWGIVGVIGYFTAGVIAVFSTHLVPLLLPIALQEMVLAVWLISRGFGPGEVAAEGDRRAQARLDVAEVG